MASTLSNALVAVKAEPDVLMSDLMGSVIVTISVGPEQKIFTVHNDLLIATSEDLASYFTLMPDQSRAYPLPDVSSDVFAFFVEFLYARRVPGVVPGSSPNAQAKRIKQLCQLYAFAEKHKLKLEIRNKVMDAIQDGFRTFDRFPEYGLIQNIYRNTLPGSKLRKFCARATVFNFNGGGKFVEDGSLQNLLRAEPEFLDEFLDSLRYPCGNGARDARIRQHPDEPNGLGAQQGWWPCMFHVHDPEWVPYVAIDNTGDYEETPFAEGCYLRN